MKIPPGYLLFSLSLFFVGLSGCDFYHGVNRKSKIEGDIPFQCVKSAVESIPGITDVSYSTEEGNRPITLGGIQKPDQLHVYFYKISGLNGYFYFRVDYANKKRYYHDYNYINSTPPQSEIDTIRPVMLAIEKEIEGKCEMKGFSSSITEDCQAVSCPSAPKK